MFSKEGMGGCFSDFFLLALPVDEGTGRHELKLERRARSQFITSVRRAAADSDADAGPVEQGHGAAAPLLKLLPPP